jgi:hypothetical protein
MSAIDITVERQQNGSLLLSTVFNGLYLKKVYLFHSTRSAMADFRKYVREA